MNEQLNKRHSSSSTGHVFTPSHHWSPLHLPSSTAAHHCTYPRLLLTPDLLYPSFTTGKLCSSCTPLPSLKASESPASPSFHQSLLHFSSTANYGCPPAPFFPLWSPVQPVHPSSTCLSWVEAGSRQDNVRCGSIITSLFLHWSTLHPSFTTGNLCILYTPLPLLNIFALLHHWSPLQPLNPSPSSVNLCTPAPPFLHWSPLNPSFTTGQLCPSRSTPHPTLVTCKPLSFLYLHWSPPHSFSTTINIWTPLSPLVTSAPLSLHWSPLHPLLSLVISKVLFDHCSTLWSPLHSLPQLLSSASLFHHWLPLTFCTPLPPTPLYLYWSSLYSFSTIGQFCIPSPSPSSAPLRPSSSTGRHSFCNWSWDVTDNNTYWYY